VLYTTGFRGQFRFAPRFDIRHIWKPGRYPYKVVWRREGNLLRLANSWMSKEGENTAGWLGVSSSEPLGFTERSAYHPRTYPRDERRGVMSEAVPYEAGALSGRVTTGKVAFVFAVGRDVMDVKKTARKAVLRRQEWYVERSGRMSRVLTSSATAPNDPRLEQALRWATVSLDGLVMNQQGRGIYAGLPWFPNYWSRDTFISLPALLALGQFEASGEILLAALDRQSEDFHSPHYGRLPNLVSPGEIHYNTADGTWWFLQAAHAYVQYSGDREFARRILPGVIRAVEGEIQKRTDDEGLSVHGDAETWMDAAVEGKAWSPRGDRAVEVQALWFAALRAASQLASWVSEKGLAREWRKSADRVKDAFARVFWDPENQCLFDHLDSDGAGDRKPRPNQIFAVAVPPDPLLPFEQEAAVLDFVLQHLVYPHGVGSLAPEDPDFCPRHVDLESYPFDQAYHNGDVWVWLSGPLISALIQHGRVETAWRLLRSLVDLLHDEGAVGTLPELRNAVPPPEGTPNVEGTVTQAWSLAEFIRPFYQDVLGLKPRMVERRLEVEPALPQALRSVRFPARFGDVVLSGAYLSDETEKRFRFEIERLDDPVALRLRVRVPGGRRLVAESRIESPGTIEYAASMGDEDQWRINLNGDEVPYRIEETPFDIAAETVPEFRTPHEPSRQPEVPRK
jgi:glycogen debranching enzyme